MADTVLSQMPFGYTLYFYFGWWQESLTYDFDDYRMNYD